MKKNLFLSIILLIMQPAIAQDWPNMSHYKDENKALGQPAPGEKRIVFMGNSITEEWIKKDRDFFKSHKLINRGIGGQTTPQMLLRFHQDVIDLKPSAVIILAGINDIAGNTGPSTLEMIENNIESMAVLAKNAGINVVLCSLLPANKIPWAKVDSVASKVSELNLWIKTFAKENNFMFVDYFSALVDADKGLPLRFSADGIHPNIEGYKLMEQMIEPIIQKLRK